MEGIEKERESSYVVRLGWASSSKTEGEDLWTSWQSGAEVSRGSEGEPVVERYLVKSSST